MAGKRTRRVSAALLLGALAGALAALTVMATAIPLTRQLVSTEQALSLRHSTAAAAIASTLVADDNTVPDGTDLRLQVEYLEYIDTNGVSIRRFGKAFTDEESASICKEGALNFRSRDGVDWAASCVTTPAGSFIAARVPRYASTDEALRTVLLLSLLDGIITAMGVLSFLRPLTNLSRALDRVRAGERGVRVDYTGLTELDDLVEQLNSAAQAMEEREDAIIARIQVVQQLARLVAHEVRNPLQSLELLASLIATEDSREERAELVHSIHEEVSTLNAVVQRLLSKDATAGALRLHLVRESLRVSVEHVVSLRRREAASYRCRIEIGDISDTPAPYDSALLGRSLENLVINAMQMVPRGYGLVRISVFDEGDAMAIHVEDNGPGVDPAYGAQIFEPNITTKETGTGLGLTLVKGVVEAHGGYIVYDESSLGGARFIIRIPKVEVEPDNNDAKSTDR